jgi:hypothetical protein
LKKYIHTIKCTPPPPDLNCDDIDARNFRVLSPDPHGFGGKNDGIGCESQINPPVDPGEDGMRILQFNLRTIRAFLRQSETNFATLTNKAIHDFTVIDALIDDFVYHWCKLTMF